MFGESTRVKGGQWLEWSMGMGGSQRIRKNVGFQGRLASIWEWFSGFAAPASLRCQHEIEQILEDSRATLISRENEDVFLIKRSEKEENVNKGWA